MKENNAPLKDTSLQRRSLIRNLKNLEKRSQVKGKPGVYRSVQSVKAGHIRGGHGFH